MFYVQTVTVMRLKPTQYLTEILQKLCNISVVVPRLVDSLVVRLKLCWERPGPVPWAWMCV